MFGTPRPVGSTRQATQLILLNPRAHEPLLATLIACIDRACGFRSVLLFARLLLHWKRATQFTGPHKGYVITLRGTTFGLRRRSPRCYVVLHYRKPKNHVSCNPKPDQACCQTCVQGEGESVRADDVSVHRPLSPEVLGPRRHKKPHKCECY